jgi:flagellar assembly protein FliH
MNTPFPELRNPKPEIRQTEKPDLWLPPYADPCLSAMGPEPQIPIFEEYQEPVDPSAEMPIDWEAMQQEAETLISEAKSQAEMIREQARQQGWEQGYRNGHAQAEKEMWETLGLFTHEMRQQVERFLKTLQQEAEHYFAGLENQMLDLTLQIARKVVKEEVKQNPETVCNVIRDALRRVHGFGMIRIRVHPHDLAAARTGRTDFLNIVEGLQGIEITEDRRVEQGSCVIETEHGTIDARLSVQMDEIEQTLRVA